MNSPQTTSKTKLKMCDIKRIAVLCGGDGAEREVSLRSGRAVAEALQEGRFDAVTVDLKTLDRVWDLKKQNFDFAFLALHGDWGEDGTLQSALSAMNLPYTGSCPDACQAAMHKGTARILFARAGLTIPKGLLFSADSEIDGEIIVKHLGNHLVVKPCSGGSSIGVTILARGSEIPAAVNEALRHDSEVLIEEYIGGKELTVAVLVRDRKLRALPVIEIVPHAGFYDYKNKYTPGAADYLVPAPIDAELRTRVEEAALTAHRCLGCGVYSRSDFRLSPDGTLYILEVNTAPDMASIGLVSRAGHAAGLSFPALTRAILSASR